MVSPSSHVLKAKKLKILQIRVELMDQWCEDVILKAAKFPKLRRFYLFIGISEPPASWEIEKKARMCELFEKEIGRKMAVEYRKERRGESWVGRA